MGDQVLPIVKMKDGIWKKEDFGWTIQGHGTIQKGGLHVFTWLASSTLKCFFENGVFSFRCSSINTCFFT